VLVGATPQVLAQAAMTRQFSDKDEAEVKDDLDTTPDDCESLEDKAIAKNSRFAIEKNAFSSYWHAVAAITSVANKATADHFSLETKVGPDSLAAFSFDGRPILLPFRTSDVIGAKSIELARALHVPSSPSKVGLYLSLKLDNAFLVATSRIHFADTAIAHAAFMPYDAALDLWRCAATSAGERSIAEQTVVSWSNDDVLVVTRLPRAGLDSLLALNAK